MSPKPKGTNGEHPPTPQLTIDHRDCGAARIAYGEARVANPEIQTETHKAALAEFRKQVGERHPQLGVETGLMAVDGTMQIFT